MHGQEFRKLSDELTKQYGSVDDLPKLPTPTKRSATGPQRPNPPKRTRLEKDAVGMDKMTGTEVAAASWLRNKFGIIRIIVAHALET